MTKEKAVRISETKSTVLLRVPAYSDGKLVGWTEVDTFKHSDAGLAKAKATLTLANVDDLNRQKVTDAKNNLRRGTSALANLRKLVKVHPEIESVIEVLLKRAQSGTLDDAFLKSIGV